jgi:hypothetical protein
VIWHAGCLAGKGSDATGQTWGMSGNQTLNHDFKNSRLSTL